MCLTQSSKETNSDAKHPSEQIIYALVNANQEVFYVGRSRRAKIRMKKHRARFGNDFTVQVLQSTFEAETPGAAERKWIFHFRDRDVKLMNSVYNDRKPLRTKQREGQIAIGELDLWTWKAFRDRCRELGVRAPAAAEEALHDWLDKSAKPSYRTSGLANLEKRRQSLDSRFRPSLGE